MVARHFQARLHCRPYLVLEQGAKVEHLLCEPVERLCDAALEVAEALVGSRHVLVVCRKVCCQINQGRIISPSTRFLLRATRRST